MSSSGCPKPGYNEHTVIQVRRARERPVQRSGPSTKGLSSKSAVKSEMKFQEAEKPPELEALRGYGERGTEGATLKVRADHQGGLPNTPGIPQG